MVGRMLILGLLLLLLGLHTPVLAQSCDPGYELDLVEPMTTTMMSFTMPSTGYVELSADGLYAYVVNEGAAQQRTTAIRVGLAAGDTISYRLLTASNGSATHCLSTATSVQTPTIVPSPAASIAAYPAPTVAPALEGLLGTTVELAAEQPRIWMPDDGRGSALLLLAGSVITVACAHLLKVLVSWRKN